MRFVSAVVLFGLATFFAGCDTVRHSEVKMTVLNTTDFLICYHLSEGETGCSAEIKPNDKTTWRPGCGYGAKDEAFDSTVILIVASDGHEIYNRTANCKEWNDAHGTLIIKQSGDEFVVTDSLPEG